MAENISRRAMLAGASLSIAALPVVLSAQDGVVAGLYRAEGRNPDGSSYAGSVQITQIGDQVTMAWTVGSQSYAGTGKREGRVLEVNWGADAPVIYVVMPDGQLHGTWASGRALELLIPVS